MTNPDRRSSHFRTAVVLVTLAMALVLIAFGLMLMAPLYPPALSPFAALKSSFSFATLLWGIFLVQVDLLALWVAMGRGAAWLRVLAGLTGTAVVTVLVCALLAEPAARWQVAGHPFLMLGGVTVCLSFFRMTAGLTLGVPGRGPSANQRRPLQFSTAQLLGWMIVFAAVGAIVSVVPWPTAASDAMLAWLVILLTVAYLFPAVFGFGLLYQWPARPERAVVPAVIILVPFFFLLLLGLRMSADFFGGGLPLTGEHLLLLVAAIALLRYHGIRLYYPAGGAA